MWPTDKIKEEARFPKVTSQQQLKEERKKANLPNPSYDLDGDGIVDHKDYFLAKRFDLDQDGRLNTAEKANALNALKSGYEDNFKWKVEQTGAQRGKRLLQVRGKFVDAEDFLPVRETYPTHPLSQTQAKIQTQVQLISNRKTELIDTYKKAKEEWDKVNPSSVPQKFILSEYLVDNPKHVSMKQIHEVDREAARANAGLLKKTTEVIKESGKDPGLSFVKNPEIKTKMELEEKGKADNVKKIALI